MTHAVEETYAYLKTAKSKSMVQARTITSLLIFNYTAGTLGQDCYCWNSVFHAACIKHITWRWRQMAIIKQKRNWNINFRKLHKLRDVKKRNKFVRNVDLKGGRRDATIAGVARKTSLPRKARSNTFLSFFNPTFVPLSAFHAVHKTKYSGSTHRVHRGEGAPTKGKASSVVSYFYAYSPRHKRGVSPGSHCWSEGMLPSRWGRWLTSGFYRTRKIPISCRPAGARSAMRTRRSI